MFGKFFACFLLVKFNIDVVVIVLRWLEIRKVSGAIFVFVRNLLGATFHLFALSLQTPMYETDEKKILVIFVCRTLHLMKPQLHQCAKKIQLRFTLMWKLWTIQCRLVQTYMNHKEVILMCFSLQETLPWIPLLVLTEMLPVLQALFLNNIIIGNALNTFKNGNVPNSNGNASLPPLERFCNFTKKKLEKKKTKQNESKNKKQSLTRFVKSV